MEEICSTCLSQRALQKLLKLKPIYKLILPEFSGDLTKVKLCMKCINVLKMCCKFRKSSLKAQKHLIKQKEATVVSKTEEDNEKLLTRTTNETLNTPKSITLKQLKNVETASATCAKILEEVEIEVQTQNYGCPDPLVDEMLKDELTIESDNDDDGEVLAKVKLKMAGDKQNASELRKTKSSALNADSNNSAMATLNQKSRKKVKLLKFKMAASQKTREQLMPLNIPTKDEILEMFTSIEFCKNQFDVDGNNVEVLIMSERQATARRAQLQPESQHSCARCLLALRCPRRLRAHEALHHVARPNETECPICQSYVPHQMFKYHYGRHLVLFQCRLCLYCEETPTGVLEHLKLHTEAKAKKRSYKCAVCDINHANSRSLRLHREKVHNLDKKAYECQQCQKSFECFTYYRDHMKRHEERPVPCKLCDRVYSSFSALNYHMKSHSSGGGEAAYCVECDAQFKNELMYKLHLRNHSRHRDPNNARLHRCAPCGKVFPARAAWRDHVAVRHLRQRNHQCTDCNKSFGRAGSLRAHRRRQHEGARPRRDQLCAYCGRGFSTKKILAGHINTHTGERPYRCEECGDTFRQSAALFTHRRLVHRKRREASAEIGVDAAG